MIFHDNWYWAERRRSVNERLACGTCAVSSQDSDLSNTRRLSSCQHLFLQLRLPFHSNWAWKALRRRYWVMLTWRSESSMGWWGRWSSSAWSPSPSTLAALHSWDWLGGSGMRFVAIEKIHCDILHNTCYNWKSHHHYMWYLMLSLNTDNLFPIIKQEYFPYSGVPALYWHLWPLGLQNLPLVLLILACG